MIIIQSLDYYHHIGLLKESNNVLFALLLQRYIINNSIIGLIIIITYTIVGLLKKSNVLLFVLL